MLKKRRPEAIRDKAVALRKKGFSLSEIFNKINIPKSTVQHWIKHIELTGNQRARLKKKEAVWEEGFNKGTKDTKG